MLQDEEPGSGEPEGASHDESSQPDAGPSKKTAVKGQLLSRCSNKTGILTNAM